MLRPKNGLAIPLVLALVLAQTATARVSFRFHHTAAAADNPKRDDGWCWF